MEYQQIMWFITLAFAAAGLFPLVYNLRQCYKAILNDARIISRDPALQSNFEILYAYPGGCRVSKERERERVRLSGRTRACCFVAWGLWCAFFCS